MPQPRFITSQSQMGAPGVYVQQNAPAVPVRGQQNRIVSFVGACLRGPTGKTVTCEDYQRFIDVFGGRDRNVNGGSVIGHVWMALQGFRWGSIVVARAAASDAVKASSTLETAAGGGGTAVVRIDASSVGLWGNDIMYKVSAATDGDATHWNLTLKLYGQVKLYENIATSGADNNLDQVLGSDDANWITMTKLASGRPVNNAASTDGADADGFVNVGESVAAFTSVAGTDGTITNTDYDAPMGLINEQVGVHACAVVGRNNSTIKTAINALAAVANQRVWFIAPDDETVTYSAAIAERATFTAGDRLSYWWNHNYVTDPVTKLEVVSPAFLVVMSIISQTDPDVHPGNFDNAVYTRAIRRVYNNPSNAVRDALDAAGVSFIWRDLDQNGNLVTIPGNALTCDLAKNNRDLDGRYMKDFILLALANRMKGDIFKGNEPTNRAERAAACSGFLTDLAENRRYVQRSEDGVPQFSYTNNQSVNNPDDQADGDQNELLICQLIPKNKRILLKATIGTNAKITEQ